MSTAAPPLVSVVMPVYNTARHLEQAIASIQNQTFTNFELLLFNDGSTDDSGAVARTFADARIQLFDQAQNVGHVAHLNHAMELARGTYIACMHSDDVAHPTRLAQQVAMMENHPEVGLCGTAYREFGIRQGLVSVPETDAEIRRWMLAGCPFGHPTVMMRKSVVERYHLRYDPTAVPAEDYLLWYEFSRVTQLANLTGPLLDYRVHESQISNVHSEQRPASVNNTRRRQLLDKGFVLAPREWELYVRILDRSTRPRTARALHELLAAMWNISRQNTRLSAYPAEWFKDLFAAAWQDAVIAIKHHHWTYVQPVLLAPKPFSDPLNPTDRLKFVVKCALAWRVVGVPLASPTLPDA